jgi:cell division protein FtsX
VDAYLGGANVHSSVRFLGSASAVENVTMHNYYLRSLFDETWLSRWGVIGSAVLLAVMLVMAGL